MQSLSLACLEKKENKCCLDVELAMAIHEDSKAVLQMKKTQLAVKIARLKLYTPESPFWGIIKEHIIFDLFRSYDDAYNAYVEMGADGHRIVRVYNIKTELALLCGFKTMKDIISMELNAEPETKVDSISGDSKDTKDIATRKPKEWISTSDGRFDDSERVFGVDLFDNIRDASIVVGEANDILRFLQLQKMDEETYDVIEFYKTALIE